MMMLYVWFLFVSLMTWKIYDTIIAISLKRQQQLEAEQGGYQLPPQLVHRWPFGIDHVYEVLKADEEHHLMEFLRRRFKPIGTSLRQITLGKETFGTSEPHNLRVMLQELKDWHFGNRNDVLSPFLGKGIFTQDGRAWEISRRQLSPHFAPRYYKDLSPFKHVMQDLYEALQPQQGTVDLQPYFFKLTLDTITTFLLGKSASSLQRNASDKMLRFESAFNLAQGHVSRRSRLPEPLRWSLIYRLFFQEKEFQNACHTVRCFVSEMISESLSETNDMQNRSNFLNSIAQYHQNDHQALCSQIINILVAGRDTTACLLSWTFFLLVRHPEVLENLKMEINTLQDVTYDSLKSMEYLQAVIKEVLRLYPSVPINTRSTVRDTALPTGGGPNCNTPIFMPKGSDVGYSPYLMHRREDFYGKDALQFRPERWADPSMPLNADNVDPITREWAWLPFNGGRRICLGMDFALTEAAFVTVKLLQKYPNLSLPQNVQVYPTGQEEQTMTLVLSSTKGCLVNLGNTITP